MIMWSCFSLLVLLTTRLEMPCGLVKKTWFCLHKHSWKMSQRHVKNIKWFHIEILKQQLEQWSLAWHLSENFPLSHLKYPVVSHLQISKHHLKKRSVKLSHKRKSMVLLVENNLRNTYAEQWSKTCQPTRLAVSQLNLPSQKSAQLQVISSLLEGL